jgi:hypothetical protein
MKAWIGAVALIGTLASGSAMADGNKFLASCQDVVRHMDNENAKNLDLMGMGQCFGMLEGVRATLMVVNEALPPKARFCFPKGGINNGQAARIVTKYLRDNPAELHEPEAFLVISAYKQAFPCS